MFRVLILCLLFAPAALAEGLISRDPVLVDPNTQKPESRALQASGLQSDASNTQARERNRALLRWLVEPQRQSERHVQLALRGEVDGRPEKD
jgi:hypothetical protein